MTELPSRMRELHEDRLLQLGQVRAHVQVADELAVVGDRVDQVQRRQSVEAMLVRAALDRLLLPFLDRRELAVACSAISIVLLPA